MNRRTFEEMVSYFNQTVADMDIDRKYKMELLGMITAILQRHDEDMKHAPTIEPKKGKWIPVTRIYKVTEEQFPKTHIEWVDATDPDEIDGVRCSECGTVYDFIEARNWCSECGALKKKAIEAWNRRAERSNE